MAKRNADRNKKRRERQQRAKTQQAQTSEPATPQPPPEEAALPPVEARPEVDPAIIARRAELQASFDADVARGNACMTSGDIQDAFECETRARTTLKESKRLVGIDPIGPDPVRKLKSAIDEYVRNAQREKERERAELKQYAQDRLRDIHETAGSRIVLANHVAYTRDVRSALELIRSIEPHIRNVLSEEFRKLEEELESEALYRDITEARSRVAQITLTMQTDLDTAQQFLDGFPANLRQHVELDALRKEIEHQRPVFERQRRERERLEEVDKASELLEHILGTRYHRVKSRESAERLRQAQAEQPELLERAIQFSVYDDLSELQEEIKRRRENATKMWQGFQELEYLEEADSSSELIKRLIAVAHRGLLEQIMDHRGYYAKRDALVSREHRTAIRDRIDELMKSDCPDCWKLAVFFLTFSERKEPERRNRNGGFGSDRYLMSWDEMFCDWDGQARSDFVWSWDARGYGEHLIVELSKKLRVTTEGTSCGQHQPTQAPWQKRTKQSSKRDENANAQ